MTPLNVRLDGDAKKVHSYIEGYYSLTSDPVNGKKYWIHVQGLHAIWYNNEVKGWLIGSEKDKGTKRCSLYTSVSFSNDAKSPEEATTWAYFGANGHLMPTFNIFVLGM